MEGDTNFKKVFLIIMIISLSISALVGIVILLLGDFGDIQAKILFTTLTIGGFSLTALCSSALYDKNRFRIFSVLGIICAIIGFLVITSLIWGIFDLDEIVKTSLVLVVLSISFAHSSLLLLIKSRKTVVNVSLSLTLLFVATVAFMLIFLILSDFNIDSELFFRFLGVFAILDALGTIITPIILKVTSLNKKEYQ